MMATFYYKASNDSGDVVEGEMQATDQAQVVRALHDRGYIPIRAEKTKSAAGRKPGLLRRSDMKPEELREFTHDLATLLNARLPLDRALGIISTSSENARLSHFAEALLDRVKKGSNLADACEAVIAALYLDGGLEVAERFIHHHWKPLAAATGEPPRDAKTHLQEWAQERGLDLPVYETVAREGPPHRPTFFVRASVGDLVPAEGQGASKRAAEQRAAEVLIKAIVGNDDR